MNTSLLTLALLLFTHPSRAAQTSTTSEDPSAKGTYLGVLFSPIPSALRAHLPTLPKSGGVMITHVLPKSPAAKVLLKRHDILLRYNESAIRDGIHLAELIRHDKPGDHATLRFIREGKTTTARVELGLGPMLQIVSPATVRDRGKGSTQPGTAKPGSPEELNVSAVPMDGNRMKVTFDFYHKAKGRFQKVTCSGTPDMIDQQIVQRLPKDVQSLANRAVEHLRKLQFQKKADPK